VENEQEHVYLDSGGDDNHLHAVLVRFGRGHEDSMVRPMIQAQLVMSMAGKGRDAEHERESVLRAGVWYIFEEGPSFRTTWRVTYYDENGLIWLKLHNKDKGYDKRTG